MCLALPSVRTCSNDTETPQMIHLAPSRFTVPSGAPRPYFTSKLTAFAFRSIIGLAHASFSFLVESQNLLTNGICAPQAGLGHVTVRAQSQAITVASPPPYSFGSSTF